jgi:hypothetical protein
MHGCIKLSYLPRSWSCAPAAATMFGLACARIHSSACTGSCTVPPLLAVTVPPRSPAMLATANALTGRSLPDTCAASKSNCSALCTVTHVILDNGARKGAWQLGWPSMRTSSKRVGPRLLRTVIHVTLLAAENPTRQLSSRSTFN